MKVFIATPCGDLSRYPEFWGSLLHQKLPPGVTLIPDQQRGTYISENQNVLARRFLAGDADYFWLTNDDQVYMPDCLARLLGRDVDICCPVCIQRNAPFTPLLYDRDDESEPNGLRPLWLNRMVRGLYKIVAAGGGGMLVKRKVMEAIKDPWWEVKTVTPPDGRPPNQMSEDIDFARKARAAGFSLWADTECIVGHQGTATFWPLRDAATGDWCTGIDRNGFTAFVPAATAPPPTQPTMRREPTASVSR